MIPISSVRFGTEEEDLVLQVLRSGAIAQGPLVRRLEEEFASQFGSKHAIAVNNGTTALVAALEVLDLQPGDEVVTSPFTFVATLNAILESGATATFADIAESDFNVSPDSVAERVTERTKVILPVHLYGQMSDMDPIMEIAQSTGARVLEDVAQSHGAMYNGRFSGTFGLGTFSFYATKNITTGEGGMITTDDDVVADRLRVLRNQGMRERYVYEVAGHNYRLTDLQAALALPQLTRYAANVEARRRNADRLSAGLVGLAGVVTPPTLPGRTHVWHQYTIRVTGESPVSRDELVRRLYEKGVGTGVYYPKMLFDYDAYRAHPRVKASDVPVATRIATQVVSLPVHNHLTADDVNSIIASVRDVIDR